MPKLRSLDVPDYDCGSASLLKRFALKRPLERLGIDLYHRHRPNDHTRHLESPQVWVRIVDKYRDLFATVTMLDVGIPKDAFDFKREDVPKVEFPLLVAFPKLSILTLRMCSSKPEYLAFVLQTGRNPRGRKYKPSECFRPDRLNLHIERTNAWAAGVDRMVKGYASQGVPLPAIWLFFGEHDRTAKPQYMSELNEEWLQTIPGLKVFDESLLENSSRMDVSVSDPREADLRLPIEYVRSRPK